MIAVKLFSAALLVAALPRAERPDRVGDFHCHGDKRTAEATTQEVYTAYGLQSVEIIKAGLAGDQVSMRGMVAPTAEFSVFDGDFAVRSRSKGAGGAMEFARDLKPDAFEFSGGPPGPVGMDPCGAVATEVTTTRNGSNEAVVLKFEYREGLLVRVTGTHGNLYRGRFNPPTAK